MAAPKKPGSLRATVIVVAAVTVAALISTSTGALLARLTRIPLGRGTATIRWTGAADIKPTIQSVKGEAGGYSVSASGEIPKPTSFGSTSSIPSQLPLATIKGTIGGTPFTLSIVLTLPTTATPAKPLTFGHVTGTFRNEPVAATLTANANSSSFGFKGTIGTLHVGGVISQPRQHGNAETAHASFDVTK
jgi:hypothetical protein